MQIRVRPGDPKWILIRRSCKKARLAAEIKVDLRFRYLKVHFSGLGGGGEVAEINIENCSNVVVSCGGKRPCHWKIQCFS